MLGNIVYAKANKLFEYIRLRNAPPGLHKIVLAKRNDLLSSTFQLIIPYNSLL
ncbi:hypothetical protein SAMN03080594_1142 [Arenibacter palladensis]|uniref:Uncharacterized protein n=1 Tax=Arenibacter palladensis TaxID=237373 RepID=A0A1M5HD95_9FLAO|nr:hypothetical protein SAMN03080594_1142 [Arenibacter palladensis]